MDKDKLAELQRYEGRAHAESVPSELFDVLAMPAYLRTPYLAYADQAAALIRPGDHVLELGAGTGLHTETLARTGARVLASDISPQSLAVLQQRLARRGVQVDTRVADMEALPFDDNAFDVVACAGSLSYGDPGLVDAEIRRVLRPGGAMVCVDSLNHNPIYRLNRLVHCLRGNRTRSTLVRMPDLARIGQMSSPFQTVELQYFGALSFAMPALAGLVGQQRACAFSDWFDQQARVRRSAFKFVMVARLLRKS